MQTSKIHIFLKKGKILETLDSRFLFTAARANSRNHSTCLFQRGVSAKLPYSSWKINYLKSRSLFIQTELTPNVNSIKFKPGKSLKSSTELVDDNGQQAVPASAEGNASETHEFLSRREAMKSPLATNLFAIDGVESVMFGCDFITITKSADSNWQLMKPDIYGSIMDFFSSKTPLFHTSEKDTAIKEEDSEVVAMIKELLDTRIRPTIQDDGGDVEYVGFENGVVRLKLRGACRTCDSSSVTLKNGIEKMLMHYVPEVEEVIQVLEEHEEVSKTEFAKLERELKKGQ